MTDLMRPEDIQLSNEYRFSKRHIDDYIDLEIRENPEMIDKIIHGVYLLEEYVSKEYSYESKNERVKQLEGFNFEDIVRKVFIGVAYCQTPELFTSVSAKMAGFLGFSEKADGIKTVAEILAVLCMTDAFDIYKPNKMGSLMVESLIPLSDRLVEYVINSRYLPPMVCEPKPVTSNFESPYLTHNDSLILGKGNNHSEDICLDVINVQNRVPLKLNVEFLSTYEEEPTFDLDTPEKKSQWDTHKRQSYELYSLMVKQGNRFYLTHKVDKRGRLYAQGYHITTQGTAFKKACVDLADEEVVEGVPEHLRT